MITDPVEPRIVAVAVLLAGAALSFGCGARSRTEAAGSAGGPGVGSAGAANLAPRLCDATLEIAARAPIELDCEKALWPRGGGFYRLELASAQGDTVTLDLPAIEAGFWASPECLTANIALRENGSYVADQLAFPDSVATINADREGDVLSGVVAGIFYAFGDGAPDPYITPTLRLKNIPISQGQVTCDCGPPRNYDNHCEVLTCDTGTCSLNACPVGAKLCQAR